MRLLSEGMYDQAITAFASLKDYRDSKNRIKQAEADKLFDAGDYIGAIDIYSTLNSKYNKHEQEYEKTYNHGESLRREGKYENAVGYFQRIGVYKDSPAKIIQSRADKLYSENNYSDAYELYKTIDSKYNDHIDDYRNMFNKAEELVKQKSYEEALPIYKSLGSYGNSDDKYLGTINLIIQKAEAEKNYTKAKILRLLN